MEQLNNYIRQLLYVKVMEQLILVTILRHHPRLRASGKTFVLKNQNSYLGKEEVSEKYNYWKSSLMPKEKSKVLSLVALTINDIPPK